MWTQAQLCSSLLRFVGVITPGALCCGTQLQAQPSASIELMARQMHGHCRNNTEFQQLLCTLAVTMSSVVRKAAALPCSSTGHDAPPLSVLSDCRNCCCTGSWPRLVMIGERGQQRRLVAGPVAPHEVQALPKHDAQQRQPCSRGQETTLERGMHNCNAR